MALRTTPNHHLQEPNNTGRQPAASVCSGAFEQGERSSFPKRDPLSHLLGRWLVHWHRRPWFCLHLDPAILRQWWLWTFWRCCCLCWSWSCRLSKGKIGAHLVLCTLGRLFLQSFPGLKAPLCLGPTLDLLVYEILQLVHLCL